MEFSLWTPNTTVAQFIGMAVLKDVFGVVANDMPVDEFEAVCMHWEVVGPLRIRHCEPERYTHRSARRCVFSLPHTFSSAMA